MIAHLINKENVGEAQQALSQVLLLYVSMAESYSGFGHAADAWVHFDPLKFVDAELQNYPGWAPLVDLDLLRAGSAIAILCSLYDDCVEDAGGFHRYGDEVRAGKLRHVPDIEAVAFQVLEHVADWSESPLLDQAVEPTYQDHVIGYFGRLSRMHRREGGDWPWKS